MDSGQGPQRYIPVQNGGRSQRLSRAATEKPEFYAPEAIAKQLRRIGGYTIYLQLYDGDGFQLRQITVPFSVGVDDQGLAGSLEANSSEQMDASEYRQFVPGSWAIGWSC